MQRDRVAVSASALRRDAKAALYAVATSEVDEQRGQRIAMTMAARHGRVPTRANEGSSAAEVATASAATDSDSDSSASDSGHHARKKRKREKERKRGKESKRDKKKERKREKRERKLDKRQRREVAARESHELPEALVRGFVASLRESASETVADVLKARPDLLHARVPFEGGGGRETWSVVHEAVWRCPSAAENLQGTALARYAEEAALRTLSAVLSACEARGVHPNRLQPRGGRAAGATEGNGDGADGGADGGSGADGGDGADGGEGGDGGDGADGESGGDGGHGSDGGGGTPFVSEPPLHLAAWRGSVGAVERLVASGASLFERAADSSLLPVHAACDRRAPAYLGGGSAFVGWLVERMRLQQVAGGNSTEKGAEDMDGAPTSAEEGADGADGAPSVDVWLRTDVPRAFWVRGCDHTRLGIETLPAEFRSLAVVDTRQVAEYRDLDDPLFD